MSNKANDTSWDGLVTEYLKPSDFSEPSGFVICSDVEVNEKDNKPYMKLSVTLNNGSEKIWDLNKTNRSKLQELGLKAPKEAIGKKIWYKVVLATNPTTKKEVDALRIAKIE
jgi:hypothetical protein